MGNWVIVGAGGHARVVIDAILDAGDHVVGLFDSSKTGEIFGIRIVGPYDPKVEAGASAVVAIGDNAARQLVSDSVHHPWGTLTHRSAKASSRANIDAGSMLLHGCIVQASTTIGKHVILNTGSMVDHDCRVEDFAHIAPGAVLCGNVGIGQGTLVGTNATVLPGRTIGKWAVIGAGAVVNKDVPDYAVVVGSPARIVKFTQKK